MACRKAFHACYRHIPTVYDFTDILFHLTEKFRMLHVIMESRNCFCKKSFVVVEKTWVAEAGDVGLNICSVTDLLQYKLLHSKVICKDSTLHKNTPSRTPHLAFTDQHKCSLSEQGRFHPGRYREGRRWNTSKPSLSSLTTG